MDEHRVVRPAAWLFVLVASVYLLAASASVSVMNCLATTISVQSEKDQYLQRFPNSINQVAPDIWWLKAAALGASWLTFVPAVLILALCAVAAAFRLRRVNA